MSVIFFVFGLIVGSFLNAVIYRLHTNQSILEKSSRCPHCRHELSWLDLLPVASFFMLRGKCRYCRKPISWQYPAVELITGLIFVVIPAGSAEIQSFSWIIGSGPMMREWWEIVLQVILACFLIVIFVYDLKHYLILDKVLLPGIILVAIYNILINRFWSGILGAGILSGFFLILFLASRGRWIGAGDVKLGAFLGMLIPFPQTLALFFIAYFSGALVSVFFLLSGKKNLTDRLPFGTFLSFAAFCAMLWGEEITNWYLKLIGIY